MVMRRRRARPIEELTDSDLVARSIDARDHLLHAEIALQSILEGRRSRGADETSEGIRTLADWHAATQSLRLQLAVLTTEV
jgi:hypothetical protein